MLFYGNSEKLVEKLRHNKIKCFELWRSFVTLMFQIFENAQSLHNTSAHSQSNSANSLCPPTCSVVQDKLTELTTSFLWWVFHKLHCFLQDHGRWSLWRLTRCTDHVMVRGGRSLCARKLIGGEGKVKSFKPNCLELSTGRFKSSESGYLFFKFLVSNYIKYFIEM